MMRVGAALLIGAASAEKIMKVNIQSSMSDSRDLYFSRGSSSCWGIPGLAPQQDGSINVVPDEGNLACTCSDDTCDYFSHLLMPLYLDSKWDIFHQREEFLGHVEFAARGKKDSTGAVQWNYRCEVIDAAATRKITCDEVSSPDPSTYFKAYQVSLSDPSFRTASKDLCSLYTVEGTVCDQSDIDCQYTKYAKVAESSLKDGTCASQGYTAQGTSTTRQYPVIGNITVTQYKVVLQGAKWQQSAIFSKQPSDTCSLYSISGDVCGQSDIDCQYMKYAKLAEKALKDGTCASQGYAVKGTSTIKQYPVIGDITITQYTKEALAFTAWANSTSSTCSCFNTCSSKTWEECCACNDCAKDPAVAPHCTSTQSEGHIIVV